MPDAPQLLPDPFLRMRAGDIACPAPLFATPQETVARAAVRMAKAGATAALVRETEGGALLGILTERDVLVRVVAAGKDAGGVPVGAVMSGPVLTVRPDELLIEAFARMVRHAVRRLALLDASGQPVGLLGEGDILAARGENPLALAGEIQNAPDEAALARAFARLSLLAARCVSEGIGSEAVGRLISEMHDRIMSRAWGLALAEVQAEAGPAPAPHAVLVLGSQARREQFLATDQDLALAYETAPGASAWFAHLGKRLTALLVAVGFPPCPKHIMLDNPAWRRDMDGWLDLTDSLAATPDAEAVVLASLLADLRPLPAPPGTGEAAPDLGQRLRAAVAGRLAGNTFLLKLMAREAVRFSPPLGLFRGFSLKKDTTGRDCLDVKRGGVFPITQGVKVLAVEHRLSETGTMDRLRALKAAGVFSAPMAEGLCEALALLQTLRMRAQAEAKSKGLPLDNNLYPDALGPLERDGLRGAFKIAQGLQELLSEKYALHLIG
ncbi:MAG: putative nucleotidyltransferase substrate binding domain-containing protein [Humidesulfovibrio sp.]|nr:putative nucleotidyltransferase substrate binding domain-containing protein [Humidesulfovibrio sp.]